MNEPHLGVDMTSSGESSSGFTSQDSTMERCKTGIPPFCVSAVRHFSLHVRVVFGQYSGTGGYLWCDSEMTDCVFLCGWRSVFKCVISIRSANEDEYCWL